MQTLKINRMGESHNAGPVPTVLSLVLALFAWVTFNDVKVWLSIVASIAAIICAVFGAINHWLSIKEKRKALNQK